MRSSKGEFCEAIEEMKLGEKTIMLKKRTEVQSLTEMKKLEFVINVRFFKQHSVKD